MNRLRNKMRTKQLEDYEVEVNELNSYWEAVKDIVDGREPTSRRRIYR